MMAVENPAYASLVNALTKMLGKENAALVVKYLEQENVIMGGSRVADAEKLDIALQSLFGQGASGIIRGLMVQKSRSRGRPTSPRG